MKEIGELDDEQQHLVDSHGPFFPEPLYDDIGDFLPKVFCPEHGNLDDLRSLIALIEGLERKYRWSNLNPAVLTMQRQSLQRQLDEVDEAVQQLTPLQVGPGEDLAKALDDAIFYETGALYGYLNRDSLLRAERCRAQIRLWERQRDALRDAS